LETTTELQKDLLDSISPNIPVTYCENNIIEQVIKFKHLGLILDAKLSFVQHLNNIKKSKFKGTSQLFQILAT
jgi:hypothetical protein